MDCQLVFYAARKTSFCERALRKSFSELDLNFTDASFATDAVGLGSTVSEAFEQYDVVFVIGGLGFDDYRETGKIFSAALADTDVDEYKKLRNESGEDGYVIRAKNQLLILLPDEPEQIENIMQGPIGGYIKITENERV